MPMRTTALITLLSGAAMAASKHTIKGGIGGKDPVYDGVIYAPPVTATVTETTTAYDTITSYKTTVTAHHTDYELAPPVTATVTEFFAELYDQSYDNGYELGDIIVAPTVITETKTFTVVARAHDEEKTRMTELVQKWSIKEGSHYKTTVTEYTSTAWAQEHITSTIWVDSPKPTEGFGQEPAEGFKANPTKIPGLEGGYGGLKPEKTGSKFHGIDIHNDDEPEGEDFKGSDESNESDEFEESDEFDESEKFKQFEDFENFEDFMTFEEEAWKVEQQAAKNAAIEAAKKASEEADKEKKPQEGQQDSSQQPSAPQVHKPSRPHGPTPTHRPSPLHRPSASKPAASPKPSTFGTSAKPASGQTSTASKAPVAQPSVSAGKWQGKLLNTTDGTCGPKEGQIAWSCYGNERGSCCSPYGHCGSEPGHCGEGCQSAFGTCGKSASKPAAQSSDKVGKPPHRTITKRAVPKNETELENKEDRFLVPVLF
ncbi:uncharacterized protein N0V89_007252 [Didymosphaeria variabile]|uniref:Chitin-binding type-1 domain-containing protein n=1 Tax=Didymosphaeria variabile TaxID=1932322 RepID=A0A9W9CA27_9PLEO|nr:uncharacterized protein N0V89_007252 [Didymosphaeria variabile]KAJ4351908.1 hypothetical protein N0V89_007252 [Didymosphaeria variabile]